ncbi:MAG: hypothetical protein IJV98_01945 [Clostridia bacterium]|nr:hypothetical protein [Clostridia bacterium]
MAKNKDKYGKDEAVERVCAYCEFALPLPTADGEDSDMICEKRGVVRADHVCGKFRYDLLKRTPSEKLPVPTVAAVTLDD